MIRDLERAAVRRGLGAGGAIAVPLAVIAWAGHVQSSARSAGSTLLSLGALAAFFVAAFVAGRAQAGGRPLTHGLIAALGTFAMVVVIRLLRALVSDDAIDANRMVSNLLLALIFGSIGGLVGGRARTRVS